MSGRAVLQGEGVPVEARQSFIELLATPLWHTLGSRIFAEQVILFLRFWKSNTSLQFCFGTLQRARNLKNF